MGNFHTHACPQSSYRLSFAQFSVLRTVLSFLYTCSIVLSSPLWFSFAVSFPSFRLRMTVSYLTVPRNPFMYFSPRKFLKLSRFSVAITSFVTQSSREIHPFLQCVCFQSVRSNQFQFIMNESSVPYFLGFPFLHLGRRAFPMEP